MSVTAKVNTFLCVFLALLAACASACVARPSGGRVASLGTPGSGMIASGGARLPDRGLGFVRARQGEATAYGTPLLVGGLMHASAVVAQSFSGPPVVARIGDLSSPFGGAHPRHRSHRSGRDVDVLYFLRALGGDPVEPSGFVPLDRYGIGRDAQSSDWVELDEARTWTFIRTLLDDPRAPVQWIFCSDGVKSRLLRYAAEHETDASLLVRASIVLHRPSDGRPHDDHFHVRLACTAEERAQGCYDYGPVWPWLRRDHEKPAWPEGAADTDEELLSAILEPITSSE